jgi:hypothetical protein
LWSVQSDQLLNEMCPVLGFQFDDRVTLRQTLIEDQPPCR